MAIEGLTNEELAILEADRNNVETEAKAGEAEVSEVASEEPTESQESEENGLQGQEQKAEKEVKEHKETKPPEGYVPHGALHEERAKRKELQKQLQELNEKYARADERLKMLFDSKPQPEPSFDEDPIGYSKYEIDRVKQNLENVSKQYPEQLNEIKGELETLRLQRTIEKYESLFERENPDYREAVNFYAKSRVEMLRDMGYEDEEAGAALRQELSEAVSRAIANNKNPAEIAYKLAVKAGFKAKQETKKIDTLQKSETASKSLSDSSGKTKGALTAEALAEMSDEDFKKLSGADFRKAFGG